MAFKMKAGKEGPMRKNFGDTVTPMNFNAGLKAASKAGKLDNNPKFKAAVDKAPTKLKKDGATTGTMDKRRNLKKLASKAKDFIKNNPEVLVAGPVRPTIDAASKAIRKAKERAAGKRIGQPQKQSPKKFIGKIGKALGGALGSTGKGALAGLALGGPVGALAGGALGSILGERKRGGIARTVSEGRGRGKGKMYNAPMMLKETGGSVGAVDKKKQRQLKRKLNKLEREHNRAARKTEGSRLKQAIRRKRNK